MNFLDAVQGAPNSTQPRGWAVRFKAILEETNGIPDLQSSMRELQALELQEGLGDCSLHALEDRIEQFRSTMSFLGELMVSTSQVQERLEQHWMSRVFASEASTMAYLEERNLRAAAHANALQVDPQPAAQDSSSQKGMPCANGCVLKLV